MATDLTFGALRDANAARCARWHPGFPTDETWTGADWSNALGGEAGELAEAALAIVAAAGKVQNTVKKIRRYETGTNTAPDKPLDQLWAEFDAEMADVACYLDLLATKYGRDLAAAVVAKFNAVSIRQDFPERLGGDAELAQACRGEQHHERIQDLERQVDGNAIARSILGHREFCADCLPHVKQALAALGGASINQLATEAPRQ